MLIEIHEYSLIFVNFPGSQEGPRRTRRGKTFDAISTGSVEEFHRAAEVKLDHTVLCPHLVHNLMLSAFSNYFYQTNNKRHVTTSTTSVVLKMTSVTMVTMTVRWPNPGKRL